MDFIRITFVDILDIVLVAMLMYYLYKVLRGTHAMSILSGILLLFVVYIVVRALNMEPADVAYRQSDQCRSYRFGHHFPAGDKAFPAGVGQSVP